jgi:hypothetical protein
VSAKPSRWRTEAAAAFPTAEHLLRYQIDPAFWTYALIVGLPCC